MSQPDPSDTKPIAGERDKHIDHAQQSPSGEARRQQIAIAVAGASTALLLWLLWAGPNPQHKAEHKAVRQTAVFEPAMEKPAPKEPPRLATMTGIKPAAIVEPPPPAPPPPDPMLEASRKAPVLAVSKRESTQSRASAITTGSLTPEIEADDKGQFERRLKPPKLEGVRAGLIGNPNFVVPQGTAISCTLETAMQSDQPGFVSCVIPRDVLGANGRVVLLERGTQVTGEYLGGLRQGQVRLHVLWSRARSPAGVVVDLGSPATDPLGRAGVGGEIDTHWWERFGSALLMSVVGDGMRVLTKAGQSATGESFNGVGQAGNQAAAIAVEQSINMPPTLHKAQGELVTIFVARDLDFSSVYRLTLAPPPPAPEPWHATLERGNVERGDGRSLKD